MTDSTPERTEVTESTVEVTETERTVEPADGPGTAAVDGDDNPDEAAGDEVDDDDLDDDEDEDASDGGATGGA